LGRVRHDPNFLLDDKDPAAMGFRLFFTVGACLNLVGLALGFGGMTDPTRKKVFAALGLAFNATITLTVLGLMVLRSMSP
jgi:hypothetical protein